MRKDPSHPLCGWSLTDILPAGGAAVTKSEAITEAMVEMMTNLDAAVDRIRDVAELLELEEREKKTLRERLISLESEINDLKAYFRSLPSLDDDIQKSLDSYLR
jgi:hypothetical protein